jgi:hypothetical protein
MTYILITQVMNNKILMIKYSSLIKGEKKTEKPRKLEKNNRKNRTIKKTD